MTALDAGGDLVTDPPTHYKIRPTLMGWQVTNLSYGYTFTATLADAFEQVAIYELQRLAGWEWRVIETVPGGVYLLHALTGRANHFHNHEQAALFLHARDARNNARKATA